MMWRSMRKDNRKGSLSPKDKKKILDGNLSGTQETGCKRGAAHPGEKDRCGREGPAEMPGSAVRHLWSQPDVPSESPVCGGFPEGPFPVFWGYPPSGVCLDPEAARRQIIRRCLRPGKETPRACEHGEKMAFEGGLHFATGLIGGCCRLCEECVAVQGETKCRFPFKARPSMEAMGIDVFSTLEKVGLPVSGLPVKNRVTWTGLILI